MGWVIRKELLLSNPIQIESSHWGWFSKNKHLAENIEMMSEGLKYRYIYTVLISLNSVIDNSLLFYIRHRWNESKDKFGFAVMGWLTAKLFNI